jgi:hypothetical protein
MIVDYSPNHKSPLSRTHRCASTKDIIGATHERFIEERIKKGWTAQA